MQGLTSLYSEAAGILVVNDKGEMISNEMYERTPTDLTKEPWYLAAVANEGIFKMIGKPVNRNIRSHVHYREDEVVSAVRAVIDPETQRVKGVVLIDLKLRVLAEATKNIRLGKTGYLMIMDENGGNIYAPETSKLFLPKKVVQSRPVRIFFEADQGRGISIHLRDVFLYELDNGRRF